MAPSVVLTAGLLMALVLAAVGRNPIWPDHHLNLSEAVAAEDDAALVNLIARGVDVNAKYPVRPPLIASETIEMTPLEAAVQSRRAITVERLLDRGASVSATDWTRLYCGAPADIAAALERHRPAGASSECQPRP